MNKERLLKLRDEFWEKMITESIGKDAYDKVEAYANDYIDKAAQFEVERSI